MLLNGVGEDLRVPWTSRRSNQSILKEINPEYSLEGVMLKLQYFGHLLGRDAAAKLLQSCPTLCDPRDGSPPGSPIPGILQARTLDCVAISFSSAWKWKVKVKSLSRVRLLATPWTAAYHAYFLAKLNSVLCPVLQLHFVITVCLCGSLIPITLNIQRWPSNLTLLICLFPRK